ncbi:MAG: kelch repeat-containing protein, partial [Candidatus Binatus sp.]
MKNPRSHHSATLLADGRVLIAGGKYGSTQLLTMEIFNPATRTFALTASLKQRRQDHTATLLDDGTVLIAGGSNASGPTASAEIYNPTTNTVIEAASLNQARTLATASELYNFDGTVLVEGGQGAGGTDLNTAEVYDPVAQTFTMLAAQMITPRSGHVGVTLPYNGKVLIAGGTSAGQPVAENELYDPVAGTFVANEPMSVARDEFAANFFALPAVGQVLMSGGADASGNPLALSEMYSYQTIRTDMADYPPGSPVTIYGAGFAPGETVTLQIQETDTDDTWLTDTADSTGSFTDNSFMIQDNDGGVKFLMTATGATSGLTAQYRFTDALHVSGVTVGAQSPSFVTTPGAATYPISITTSGSGTLSTTLSVSGLPTGATGAFVPPAVACTTQPNCNATSPNSTLTVTVPGTVANGLYTFTVNATGNMGSAATGTLQVGPPVAVTAVHVSTQSPATVTAGAAAGFTVSFTTTGAGTEPSASLSVLSSPALPVGTTATFTPNPNT